MPFFYSMIFDNFLYHNSNAYDLLSGSFNFHFPMCIHQRPPSSLSLSFPCSRYCFSTASPSSASSLYFSYRRHPHSLVPAASSLALSSLPLLVECRAFVIVYIPFVSCIIILKPPWPNGQGVGLLIRRLRVRVPQGVRYLPIPVIASCIKEILQ